MGKKIKVNDVEYDVDSMSDNSRKTIATITFISNRIAELGNMRSVLQKAKNGYVDDLKKEILTNKAGVLFGVD
jgi:hypothetical protein